MGDAILIENQFFKFVFCFCYIKTKRYIKEKVIFIRPDKISRVIREQLDNYDDQEIQVNEVGQVLRVVDALGRPIDGKGAIVSKESRLIVSMAPGIIKKKRCI